MRLGSIFAACLTIALFPQAAAAAEPTNESPAACMSAVIDRLAAPAQQALARIDGLPRQMLAASMYLQARALEARWSWTDEQIRLYR